MIVSIHSSFYLYFWIISDISIRLIEIFVCQIVRISQWLSSSCFQISCLDYRKIQISDNLWILKNVVPDFMTLITFPCGCFQFCSSPVLIFGICQKLHVWYCEKNCKSNQANISRCRHCAVVVFVNLPNIYAKMFERPYWST